MVIKKNLFSVVLVLVLAFTTMISLSSFVQADNSTIGYVNVEEVYDVHPEMQKIDQKLQETMMELQQDFQEQMAEIDQEDAQQMQQLQQQFQRQMQIEQQEQEENLMQKVQPDLEAAREELGLEIIVHQQVVISGGIDVTAEVVEFFENLE